MSLASAMVVFGTIGLFVRNINMPSSVIAFVRGTVGALFLIAFCLVTKKKFSFDKIKEKLLILCLSGAAIGVNWIFLFEAYRYTTVATATLCYYMAPIIIILVSPIILRERLSIKKAACVILALFGMVCISGVLSGGLPSAGELRGILLGLLAAVLYAAIVLMNKQIHGISAYDKTIFQLAVSIITMIPYCLLVTDVTAINLAGSTLPMLLLVGIVHTGLAYYLYFGAMEHVAGQTAAMISYVDPAIAVLASIIILREPMELIEAFGAVLILGAALMSEVTFSKRKQGSV